MHLPLAPFTAEAFAPFGRTIQPPEPGAEAPCTGGVTSDDPNGGGPHPRHGGRSAVSFSDGHAESLLPRQWYWAGTPWLKPDLGGNP